MLVPNCSSIIEQSILGQSRDRFARYEEAIRQEYSGVPDAALREGRAAVHTEFLSLAPIYSTALFRIRYEDSARANLRWSLARLSAETVRDSASSSG